MRRFLVLLAAGALTWPATATAKSWIAFSGHAGGVTAGEAWDATLTFPVGRHALPLPRRPELVFTHLDSYAQRRVYARATGRRGVYRARVMLPTAGTWTVYVYAREIGSVSPDPRSNKVLVRPADSAGFARGPLLAAAVAFCGLALLERLRAERRHQRADERAERGSKGR